MSALVAGPASDDSAESYVGSAAGRALDLKLLGQSTSLGVTTGKVTSALTAVAEGAGQLLNLGSTQRAEVSGTGSQNKPEACAAALPVLDILNVGLACGSASSSVANNNPVANALGKVTGLDLSLNNALGLAGVSGLAEGTLGTVQSTVCGLPALGPVLCPVAQTATGTVNNLLNTKTLEATIGDSTTSIVTEAGKVVSTATANGAVIKLLPLRILNGLEVGPLATITVSSATATATYDRASGKSTPTVDPSLVTIKLGATDLLPVTEIKIPVGTSQTILQGTPLESDIIVAAGRNVTNPDGTVGAIADGVRLNLLKGLSGGIELGLAHAEAGVGGALAQVTPLIPNIELPRTGGTPWI
ncbi:MAG: hypothetical protein ACRDZW_10190, partial [Acidimicrobiales bacterium]